MDIEMLIQRLRHSDRSRHRIEAAKRLGKIKDPRAVEALIDALKDDKPAVRIEVTSALGKSKDAIALKPLVGALEDEDHEVRAGAAWALGEIGDAQVVETLIERLEGEHWLVVWKSAQALGKLGDERAVLPLIKRLGDESWVMRWDVAEGLGRINDLRAVRPLVGLLRDKNPDVRKKGAETLERIGFENLGQGELVLCLLGLDRAEEIVELFPGDTLSGVKSALQDFIGKGGSRWGDGESDSVKRWVAGEYRKIAAVVAKRKQNEMPGEMLPARIRPPKKGMYRMRRSFA